LIETGRAGAHLGEPGLPVFLTRQDRYGLARLSQARLHEDKLAQSRVLSKQSLMQVSLATWNILVESNDKRTVGAIRPQRDDQSKLSIEPIRMIDEGNAARR